MKPRKKLRYMSPKNTKPANITAAKNQQEEKAKSFIEALAAFLESLGLSPKWVTLISGALGLLALIYFTLFATSCGHNVLVTPEGTTVAKDGALLVMQPGFLSFAQAEPVPVPDPVVIVQKGK